MGFVGTLELSILLLVLCIFHSLISTCQGDRKGLYEYQYPFIKLASKFSSSAPPPRSGAPASSSSIPKGDKKKNGYDYIIIGGGTAGCPLATTLSQKFSVLLLERGGVPFTNANVSFLKNFHIALADTSPTSASQYFVSTDGVYNTRARVLGGGSCINAGFYTRASTSYIKTVGWDEKLVNESYPWVEKQIVFKPKLAPWQRALRDSLLEVGVSPFNGFTYDHLYGTKVGGIIFDRFGRRHTAAELLATANSDKLDVLIHATVQKIVFDTSGLASHLYVKNFTSKEANKSEEISLVKNTLEFTKGLSNISESGKKPRAVGVLFKDEKGSMHQAHLSKALGSEVIVSCGAIGTPQLLILSGIGPKSELEKFNIAKVLVNENVGKNVSDNPMNTFFVPSKKPIRQSLIQTVGITKLGVYIEGSSGFGQSSDSIQCNHGLMSAEIGQLSTIPPNQRTHHSIQAYKDGKKNIPHEAFQGGFILEKIATPLSKGEIVLASKNIDENPKITFNYFSHPKDLERCVDGVRVIEKMVKSEHFKNYTQLDQRVVDNLLNMSVRANVNLIPKHTNDTKKLEQFCKDTVITIWHYHGGCHIGEVVDSAHRVLGVDRLRVVDGSTFRESPGTNPQATVMMMGRYMGIKILRARLGTSAGI